MKKMSFVIILFSIFFINNIYSANKKAPGFALINNNGKFVYKSKLKGNLIISFWASYCKPCKKEIPFLIDLEKKYGKKKNLQLILINVDDNKGESAQKKAEKTLEEIGIVHDFLLDQYGMALKNYNPKKSVPATFLVNKRGRIIFQEIGAHPDTLKKIEIAITKLN